MSLEAMLWALKLPAIARVGVSDAAHLTLVAMADPADRNGANSWQSAATLAKDRDVAVRTIRRHLVELEGAHLIYRGDQRAVEHLPQNRRPVVWTLAVRGVPGVTRMSPLAVIHRGDTHDTPTASRGDTEGRSGVTPGVTQTKTLTSNSSTHLTQEGDRVALDTVPGRDCIHGAPANYYDDKTKRQRLPRCPYCRRIGGIILEPIGGPDHAA